MPSKTRVCIIGAGPSGLFTLRALQSVNTDNLQVDCYERYSNVGGIWNFNGKEGIESDGLEVHSAMYYGLESNGPKECVEVPDFAFPESVKTSYPAQKIMYQYILDYTEKYHLREKIHFEKWIDFVRFLDSEQCFEVTIRDLKTNVKSTLMYDYVVVATGHYNYPNYITVPGQETFPGQILHAKRYISAERYVNKRVLLVGNSYSAEDIAIKCDIAGAKRVTISYRSRPLGFKWPKNIDERPLLTKIEGSLVKFSDNTQDEYDVIMQCTGYLRKYPFMEDSLKLGTTNNHPLAPPLYKQIVFPENPKVIYMAMQDQYYTWTMFWLQAHLVAKILSGQFVIPDYKTMIAAIEEDQKNESTTGADIYKHIAFQTSYLEDLSKITGQVSCDSSKQFIEWKQAKDVDVTTFRDTLHQRNYK